MITRAELQALHTRLAGWTSTDYDQGDTENADETERLIGDCLDLVKTLLAEDRQRAADRERRVRANPEV